MIGEVEPYSVRDDSGSRFLGDLPQHWETRRLRNSVDMRVSNVDKQSRDGELHVRLCNYVDVYRHDRITERLSFMRATATPDEIDQFRLEQGDVLITKDSETWNDIGVPAIVEYTAEDLVCGYHLALLRPRRSLLIGAYLLRALQSSAVSQQFHVAANGVTRYGLSQDAIKSVRLPLPPLTQQASIVRFLDHADSRIQRYIAAKHKLIKLLEEERRSIIHRALTRGLEPNVRLKPSGVEWLGEVPEQWTLKRFKFVARVASGQIDPRQPGQKGKILIAPNHIRSGAGTIIRYETADEQGADSGKYVVHKGDVVYSKIRPNLRKAVIAEMDCLCSADMYPIQVRKSELRPAFLLLLMLSEPFTRYAVDCSMRVAMPKVNREALGDCWLWYPTVDVQDAILRFVEQASNPINRTTACLAKEIRLMLEHRNRLIGDVVTGKLDVREAAMTLPDTANELLLPGDEVETDDDEITVPDVADTEADLEA